MKHELKIVKAPCSCAKCQAAKAPQLELNVLGKLKALATLALTAKPAAPRKVVPQETEAQIAARLATVARQQLAEMVPPPPDLNAAIREHRAKEKK